MLTWIKKVPLDLLRSTLKILRRKTQISYTSLPETLHCLCEEKLVHSPECVLYLYMNRDVGANKSSLYMTGIVPEQPKQIFLT